MFFFIGMLKNHIKEIMYRHLLFVPTEGQRILIDSLADMLCSSSNCQLALIKGYAGTGKTSVVSAFVKTLNDFKMRPVLMAPTGRAAKVLSAYSGELAFTIHKKIYRQKYSSDGFGSFVLSFNTYNNVFFIVDEASMISHYSSDIGRGGVFSNPFGSGNLLDDLLKFVYNDRNCRLILIGDTAQLPPVGQEESPAMDRSRFAKYDIFECELTEVVRQSQESGILKNATIIREMITKTHHGGVYTGVCDTGVLHTPPMGYPKLETESFTDVERISGGDLIETIN